MFFPFCLFLWGICLVMVNYDSFSNIYSAVIYLPGTCPSHCQPGPVWILTVNSERRHYSFGYVSVSSVLPGPFADLIGVVMGIKNSHCHTQAMGKALCKMFGVSRK